MRTYEEKNIIHEEEEAEIELPSHFSDGDDAATDVMYFRMHKLNSHFGTEQIYDVLGE